MDKITEFRSTLEWGAIETGVKQATEEQRQKMMSYLDNLERGGDGGGACPLGQGDPLSSDRGGRESLHDREL